MPEDFEWHTDEKDPWDEPSLAATRSRRNKPRLFVVMLLLGLGVVLTGLLIYRLIDRRTTDATATIESEILTTHQLIQQADQVDDIGLFRSSLSGRNQPWSEAQEQLFVAGSLQDRPAFSLKAISGNAEDSALESQGPKNFDVVLSPDLTSAVVHFDQLYLVEEGIRAGTTVKLRQTEVYRLGERWLLASPHKAFWEGQASLTGAFLEVTYPLRDREVAERLASDLDDLVSEACRTVTDLDCPESLQMKLHFEEEIETLLAADQVSPFLADGLDLHLPTPTLVGWPVDEAGFQVLRRAYGAALLTALIAHQAGYQCCQQGPFYQALLDAQLREMGLRSWPMTTSEQLYGSRLRSLNDVGLFWSSNHLSSPVEEIWPVYALVEFLGRLTNLSTADLQRKLADASELAGDMGYWAWLQLITENLQISKQDLERAWLAFNQEMLPARQQEQPALPRQDLQLSCRPNYGVNASLYRYNFTSAALNLERQLGHEEAFIIGMPDDEGVIVAEGLLVSQMAGTRLSLWRNGREEILVQSEDTLVPVSFFQLNQSAEELLLVLNRRTHQYSLLSIQECQTLANCNGTALNGFPIWSPDRSSHLRLVSMGSYGYERRFERPISLGGVTADIIGVGKEPFWLNDENVAFISPQGGELRTVNTYDLGQRTLFTVEDIANALPASHASDKTNLALEFVSINPNDSDSLLIIAKSKNNAYFFSADLWGNEIELEHFTGNILMPEFVTDLRFSPDGRWLVISTSNLANPVSTITFYDTNAKRTLSYRFHSRYDLPIHWKMDWSADGQWLSIIDNGYIRLIAPDFDYQRLIVPDDLTCTAAAWIN